MELERERARQETGGARQAAPQRARRQARRSRETCCHSKTSTSRRHRPAPMARASSRARSPPAPATTICSSRGRIRRAKAGSDRARRPETLTLRAGANARTDHEQCDPRRQRVSAAGAVLAGRAGVASLLDRPDGDRAGARRDRYGRDEQPLGRFQVINAQSNDAGMPDLAVNFRIVRVNGERNQRSHRSRRSHYNATTLPADFNLRARTSAVRGGERRRSRRSRAATTA